MAASRRGNPVEGHGSRKVLSQKVAHPLGDMSNTDSGNPAAMRVPAGKRKTLSQKVGTPSAPKGS